MSIEDQSEVTVLCSRADDGGDLATIQGFRDVDGRLRSAVSAPNHPMLKRGLEIRDCADDGGVVLWRVDGVFRCEFVDGDISHARCDHDIE